MKRVAVFAEGQTESIFVRDLLFRIIDNSKLKCTCMKLLKGSEQIIREFSSPTAEVDFLIIDCGGDERVLSAIGERQEGLIKRGYECIIGLRDMYSQAYDKRSQGVIDDRLSRTFIEAWQSVIQSMTNADKIKLFVSVMETEAWFLSMYNLFEKINGVLSVDCIEKMLGFNLSRIDPEKEFFRPSVKVNEIFELFRQKYDKHLSDVEKLTRPMQLSDFRDATENGRCKSFEAFYQSMTAYSC